MGVPTLTLDSRYPGVMLVTVPNGTEARMTKVEAEQFGMSVIRMAGHGFMDPVEPEHAPWRPIGYTASECERDMRRMTNNERGCANPEEHTL